MSWIVLRPDSFGTGADFDWANVAELIDACEDGAPSPCLSMQSGR